jgi:hypothetical protein
MSNFLTDTSISDALNKGNPLYQQSRFTGQNAQFLNDQARNIYNQASAPGALPQQGIAAMDPRRAEGMNAQIAGAQGYGQQLALQGAGTLGTIQGGAQSGQNALQGIAAGGMPQFGQNMAQGYQNFMNPSLLGAQQALNNQANMAWNKGAAGVGGAGGGFMSSGRNAALGQAQENAATTLGMNQQQLAYNAATAAANAGAQAGTTGFQGQIQAGNALGNQALQGAQLTGNLQQAQLMPGQVQEAAGTAYQNQAQNELNANYTNQLNAYQNPFKQFQNYQAALGVTGNQNYAPNLPGTANWQQIGQMAGLFGYNPQTLLSGVGGAIGGGISDIGSWLGRQYDNFQMPNLSMPSMDSSNASMPVVAGGGDIDYGTYF